MKTGKKDIYLMSATVLLILGIFDLVRGFMHTFNIHWTAANVARLDLSVAGGDQLFLLGTFGISSWLTGILYIFLSRKAKEFSPYIIIIIQLSYLIGYIGFKFAGLSKHAEFNGLYFMMVYLWACVLTSIKFVYDKRKERMVNHG